MLVLKNLDDWSFVEGGREGRGSVPDAQTLIVLAALVGWRRSKVSARASFPRPARGG